MQQAHTNNNDIKKAFVDIDETICFYNGDRVYEEAIPNKSNIEKINKLYKNGWYIVYWTARGGLSKIDYYDLTEKQLDSWGAKYHELSVGDKPFYDLIIDDRAKRIEEL
ncbi:MAG: hypothetical protein H8E98_05630 [Bacteroidetes bacterium]|nr:hypothetical protein [Bacteroidota bacterium]